MTDQRLVKKLLLTMKYSTLMIPLLFDIFRTWLFQIWCSTIVLRWISKDDLIIFENSLVSLHIADVVLTTSNEVWLDMKFEIFNQYRYCFARISTSINILCTHFEPSTNIIVIKEWTMIYSTWLDQINIFIHITYQSWHRIRSQLQDVLEFKEMMTSYAVIIA